MTRSDWLGFKHWRTALGLALGVGVTATDALAQQGQDAEIVVTATRRATALQDVPVAVTPVTAQMVENAGVRDIQDLTAIVPSLQFNVSENETSATARLRGIGTQGSNPGLESSVGVFIDGVYRARNGVALSDIGEVQQIEVLRGPQGTLFGRNTSAGLINIVTVAPNFNQFEAGGDLTYGAFNETRASAFLSGPMVENVLAGRLFAARSTRDGFIDVTDFNGNTTDTNTRDLWTVRGQLLFAVGADADFRVIADFTERDEECCAAQIYDPQALNGTVYSPDLFPVFTGSLTSPGPAGVTAWSGGYGAGNVGAPLTVINANLANLGAGKLSQRQAFANRGYGQYVRDWGLSGELTWDLDLGALTSITAYRDWSNDVGQDADYSAADLWWRPEGGSTGFGFEIFTQEFRLAGESGPVDWLVGLFYSNETLERREGITLGAQFNDFWRLNSAALWAAFDPVQGADDAIDTALDGSFLNDRYEQNGESIALFTHNIISLTPATNLSVGVRYTHESKDLDATFSTNFQGPFPGGPALLWNAAPTIDAALAGAGAITAGDFQAVINTGGGPAGMCSTDFTGVGTPTASTLAGNAQQVYCIASLNPALDGQTFRQSREEDEFSGVLALHHRFSDMISGYVSASRGYKAGGFNLDRNFGGYVQTGANTFDISYDTGFDPEFVTSFEAGLKTQWFDNALLLNIALFTNEYENYQLNTYNGIAFQVASIPEVESNGAEIDMTWRTPLEGLTLAASAAYVDATYGSDSGWVADSYNPYQRTFVLARLPGARLTNAPEWTVTGSSTFEQPIGDDWLGLAYLDFRYTTDQITGSDLNPGKTQPEYWLVNARIGISRQDERIGLELWARNLLDEAYQQIAFDVPLQSGNANPGLRSYGAFLGDPRTYGVTLRARY
jgi:iron complex outermembrane recepter protein